jgi:hypothetical protein
MTDSVVDRFLRYVVVDTQSNPESLAQPLYRKQKNLGRILVAELLAIGLSDADLDEHGYVYATIPSNVKKPVPVICFCSHMDTAPDFSGTDVKPRTVVELAKLWEERAKMSQLPIGRRISRRTAFRSMRRFVTMTTLRLACQARASAGRGDLVPSLP